MATLSPDTERVWLYCDGAQKGGTPGPMSIGVAALNAMRQQFHAISRLLDGWGTNNEAEYHAVIAGLEWALESGFPRVTVLTDSQVIARHITGDYTCTAANLMPLLYRTRGLIGRLESFNVVELTVDLSKERAHNLAQDAFKTPEGRAALAARTKKTSRGGFGGLRLDKLVDRPTVSQEGSR